ncbi:MAG: HAD family phosphatase, partial [Lachnospiraceae bacterium]|nr:HAD family phosphatase [Lachnospiraceae bacterium]
MIRNIIFDIGNVLSAFRWEGFLKDKGFSDEMIERIGNASVRTDAWYEFDKGVLTDEAVIELFIK